jgi:hypothetical protein
MLVFCDTMDEGKRTEGMNLTEREWNDTANEPLDEQTLNEMIESICVSKAEEFHMLGYESVTGKDVWDCVSSKYKELPPLHRIVNDILSLRVTGFMNWMTLSVWKQSEKNGRP